MKEYVQLVLGLMVLSATALVMGMLVSGCSELPLKQCDAAVSDADIWLCKDQVQGHYWKCEKPQDLKRCSNPQ